MKKLHISPSRQQRAVRRGGGEVLLLLLPVVTGDTPAAKHTAAIIEALAAHAEKAPTDMAAAALSKAIRERRLVSFSRYRYEVSLQETHHKRGYIFTLSVRLCDQTHTFFSHALSMTWNESQTLQRRGRARRAR